ncbi:hypothetical protein CDV36_005108 [Fusarium kuroshium]|uniref:Metallo-beta-lactamase domain-containing protein n=1 Tax=Fusarium kuroshium TaxID=2010991 RepID=A0A3M2SCJ1_9HYPO|nr:hypothetical protein CDV36_005108 [Fusarium kuroshium]
MASPKINADVNITHIGTATAILQINGVNLLTDPFFSPAGTQWDRGVVILENSETPAMALHDLPAIDAVLLSHEDHPDNLDELGRQLLDGRRVITTMDGAKNLSPRPDVRGISPWETLPLNVGGEQFSVTGVPCQHVPGNECTGFIITSPDFGETDGLPNAVYFSGDTVYFEELAEMRNKFHISIAILNVGAAMVPMPPDGTMKQITMCGKQASHLFQEIGADVLIPMHYESWGHFTENGEKLSEVFEKEGISEHVAWLQPGVQKVISTKDL